MNAESFKPSHIKQQIKDSPRAAFIAIMGISAAESTGGVAWATLDADHRVVGSALTIVGLSVIAFCTAGLRSLRREQNANVSNVTQFPPEPSVIATPPSDIQIAG